MMSFESLGLNNRILKAVRKMGFSEPTPIQSKVIPRIIGGDRDLVGLAQTGTGKTAAFGLPMIQLIDFDAPHTQGVVICPTRELCIQTSGDFKEFTRYVKGAKIVSVYGGASIENQILQIKKGAHIIVATPGRLLDLIKRKVVKISNISFVVLDEADEMLNMGFQEDLDAILSKTPDGKRTWLFSATMPATVAKIAASYMNDYIEITAGKKNSVAQNIAHTNYMVLEKDRQLLLSNYWFQQRGRLIVSEYWNKIYLFWDSITRSRTDGALVRIEMLLGEGQDIETAQAIMDSFTQELMKVLPEYIPG